MMIYNKQNPFLATIRERYSLCKPGSTKETQHLILDLGGSGIIYEVGDSIGITPKNARDVVEKNLQAMKATGEELVLLKQSELIVTFHEYLVSHANITDISPKLLRTVYAAQSNQEKKQELEGLLEESNRELLKAYLNRHEVWDFLLAHEEVTFTPQDFVDLLMPMLPRFYSISSAQAYVGEEVHLTVAPVEYESNGHKRRGVCTHYICEMVEVGEPAVPVFIQPAHGFRLPEDPHASLIMIGPGTGIAPFRAFMQERIKKQSKGKHWLFFGEWNREHHFFYEDEWQHFSMQGHLKLDTAFSRDQEQKVYVQHRMQESGEEFFAWIEQGAYLFVCGDAQRMARDVEASLLGIIQEYGRLDAQAAKEYLKKLRQQKRYLRDVY